MKNSKVGILITGNELLSFKTKDTNGPYMGKFLRRLGIPICASMMCADDEKDILNCLTYLSSHCDFIFMTGGLGPTSDDLTAEIVAKFFQLKTVFFEKAWENCMDAYRKFNRTNVPESNKKQAYLPEGSRLLENKIGTAVGFKTSGIKFEKQVSIFCMPGVPYEMEPMFLNEVYPELSAQSHLPLSKTWQVFYLGESAMQSAIDETEKKLQAQFPTSAISYQAHPGFVTYSVTLFPENDDQRKICATYLENEYSNAVLNAFHKHILYCEDVPLNEYLMNSYFQKQLTLSFFEASCGGTLSKQVSSVANVEKVMKFSSCYQEKFETKLEFLKLFENHIGNTEKVSAKKADVFFAEWGAPSPQQSSLEMGHGNFILAVAIHKDKIKNSLGLSEKLNSFSWTPENNFMSLNYILFVCEFKVTTRYAKESQQIRVALNALCTLAYIVDYL